MMATILKFIVAGILVFYIGECLGLYMQCDNFDNLQCVKSYVWLVPFLQLMLIFMILIHGFKEKNFKTFVGFFTVGQTSTMILSILADCIGKEAHAVRSRKNFAHYTSVRRVYRAALAALLSCIIVNPI